MSYTAGPILFARGADREQTRLHALLVLPREQAAPDLSAQGLTIRPECVDEVAGHRFWQYVFALPARDDAFYELQGTRYTVAADFSGDVRLVYVSCNGQEEDDTGRDPAERNALWRRIWRQHEQAPYHLLLHGGDQLYADEAQNAHPDLKRWAGALIEERSAVPFTPEMRSAAEHFFLERYCALYAAPEVAALSARVPSLMMWDDHDIYDGWGSQPAPLLDSPVGKGLFQVARRMFALFQLGTSPDAPPPHCLDRDGAHFSWAARFPGFSIITPDLRSTRRPDRVMDETTHSAVDLALRETPEGDHVLLMSSVPVLGPRLSLVERFLRWLPGLQRYEDDLRDQWQSRTHREEWRRLLSLLEHVRCGAGHHVTVVSGEIHMATRATMLCKDGAVVNQLVASGIAHPAQPQLFAYALGALAHIGEAPLPGRPVRLHPLPGTRQIYTVNRNYLCLSRDEGNWQAVWEREHLGPTPPLSL